MNQCNLNILKRVPFSRLDNNLSSPVYDLLLSIKGMNGAISFPAIIDTASEYPLILSDMVKRELEEFGEPDGEGIIYWGNDILCSIYNVYIKLIDKWYYVKSYYPKDADFEDIIGLPLIFKMNICIRGLDQECLITK